MRAKRTWSMENQSVRDVSSNPRFILSKMKRGQQSFILLMRNHGPTFIFSSIHKTFYFFLYHFILIWNEIFESISQSANQSVCREMVVCPCRRNRCINNGSGSDRNWSSSGNILTLLECLLYARHHCNPFYSHNHPMTYDMIIHFPDEELQEEEVRWFAQDHKATEWWNLGVNPGILTPEPLLLGMMLFC